MPPARARPITIIAVEFTSVIVVVTLQVWLAARLLLERGLAERPALLLCSAVAGYLAADVVTGFVHWFADTFFEEETPLVGAWLVAPFREHHRNPLAMTRHGFLELTGNSCFVLAPVLGAALWFGSHLEPATTSAFYAFTLSFSCFAAATNVFHRWAHEPQAPRLVWLLQRCGLILSSDHHGRHHQSPHRKAFCVTSGWANAFLDRTGFFQHAERLLIALGLPRTSE